MGCHLMCGFPSHRCAAAWEDHYTGTLPAPPAAATPTTALPGATGPAPGPGAHTDQSCGQANPGEHLLEKHTHAVWDGPCCVTPLEMYWQACRGVLFVEVCLCVYNTHHPVLLP